MAVLTHWSLYVMLLVMTLSGWAMGSARNQDVSFLGLFTLPRLVAANKTMGNQLETVHVFSVYVLIALICLHVVAAFYHHFVRKDGLLTRMLPGWVKG